MIEFPLGQVKRVLCLGAHSDDIEIGCGGTLLKLTRDHSDVQVLWVVFSGRGGRSQEARSSAGAYLAGAGRKTIVVKRFRDGFFPAQMASIKEYFEELKSAFVPDLVFTHYRDDRHQDHRVLSDLTWNTFRNHLILEYEIPKYDGDLGIPNFFVRLDEDLCRKKVGYLCQYFQTQSNKHWFSEETFRALMRLRGMECASPTAYAEAFFCRKFVAG
jgi:LmbE family N-acetylglucosaminyl deacetylase